MGEPSQELYGLEQYLQTVEIDLQGKRRELELLRTRDQELENRQQALAEEQQRMDLLVEEIAQLEVTLAQTQRRIEEYLALVDQAPLISEGLEKLVRPGKDLKSWRRSAGNTWLKPKREPVFCKPSTAAAPGWRPWPRSFGASWKWS